MPFGSRPFGRFQHDGWNLAILFEKESPDVVGIGVAERGGLGLLEKGDTDLELTPDGVRTGLGAVRFKSIAVDKTTSLSCSKDGACEVRTRENVSAFFPCLAALLSSCFIKSILEGTAVLVNLSSDFSNLSLFSPDKRGIAFLRLLLPNSATLFNFTKQESQTRYGFPGLGARAALSAFLELHE
ncbi:hypothetical protein CR513_28803, partial [Mucuna pruriens]